MEREGIPGSRISLGYIGYEFGPQSKVYTKGQIPKIIDTPSKYKKNRRLLPCTSR